MAWHDQVNKKIDHIKHGKVSVQLTMYEGRVSNVEVQPPMLTAKTGDTAAAVGKILDQLKNDQNYGSDGLTSIVTTRKKGEITHLAIQVTDKENL